ncbi:TlpA disulfide reductase family protein [Pedobacter gandavensis]|uniref:TlpA family protein disulfide reductase n=1 Tax=Pedobacter gandavensis TaxID=2679963 RepID=UPI00292DDF11|nr:TlpA disulfide reductase family protein [Pedobacter gandavensis]
MKKIALLVLSFFISYVAFSKSDKVPKQLQGFWQYNNTNSGDWNGPLIGESFVDYQYQVYKVDSVTTTDNGHKIWLRSDQDKLNLTITNIKEGKASLLFSTWGKPLNCIWFNTDPAVKLYEKDKSPEKYNKKWAPLGSKTDLFSISKNKVNYLGKNWDLIWAGRYLDREDRILVKHKNDYQILYISDNDKNIKIVSQPFNEFFSPIATNPAIYKIRGNWIGEDTNDWVYGFYENYAIYDSKLWKYKTLNFGKDVNTVLTDGVQTKTLSISILNDSTALINDGAGQKTFYRQTGALRNSKLPDHTEFYDSKFAKVDTAIITGVLRNASNKEPFSVSIKNPLSGKQDKFYGDLDSIGFFTVKVPLLNTSEVLLDWGRTNGTDVIEPGEGYFYFVDEATKLKTAMGKNARFHNELRNYNLSEAFPMTQVRYEAMDKLKPTPFLTESTKDFYKSAGIIEKYINDHPNLSKRFRYFMEEYSKYTLGSNLMQRRFRLDRQNRERFPDGYMQFVTDSLYQQQPPKPSTLIRDFDTFANDYYDYFGDTTALSVGHADVLFDLAEKAKITVKPEEMKALIAEKAFLEYSRNVKDSVQLSRLWKAYSPAYRELTKDLLSRNSALVMSMASYTLTMKVVQRDFGSIAIAKDESLKNLLLTKTLFKLYEQVHQPIAEEDLQNFIGKVTNPFLVSLVNGKQALYKNLSNTSISYAESLKRTDHLKEAKNADSLWSVLTKPYVGKVIYVDFWGTWCAPCRGEMPFVADLKKDLKGKEVVFMYFANNSPQETWENMIKEFNLTGENVVHYNLPAIQQSMLERRLSIGSFPTYLLIDKQGKVTNMKAPRPSDRLKLVETIKGML